ncbi:unnamed protein product [Arctia plantaginis]|uniref:Uncharacterized protein n=1 Tax=Arctia plantaginis TaxID=874455 RepID=A0A8S1A2D0_ARCPL|nr:unnamed protein product [Arctia plantaginis]
MNQPQLHSGVDIRHVVPRRLLVTCVDAAGAGQSARLYAPCDSKQDRPSAHILEQPDSLAVCQACCTATVYRDDLIT